MPVATPGTGRRRRQVDVGELVGHRLRVGPERTDMGDGRGRSAVPGCVAPRTADVRTTRGPAPTAASRRSGSPTRRRRRRSCRRPTRPRAGRGGSAGRADPNTRLASLPTIEPTDMPSIAGASMRLSPSIICATDRRRVCRAGGVAERGREFGEQRAVGLERLGGPLPRCERASARGSRSGAGDVVDVQCRRSGPVGRTRAVPPDRRCARVASGGARADANCRAASQLSGP